MRDTFDRSSYECSVAPSASLSHVESAASADPTASARGTIFDAARWRFLRLAWIVLQRRLLRIEVEGDSMLPSLRSGDVVWCEARPDARKLRVGDIIVFSGRPLLGRDSTARSADWGIKRISALGAPADGRSGRGHGSCEVRGDNPDHSADSRHFGPVPFERVLARVIFARSSPRKLANRGVGR